MLIYLILLLLCFCKNPTLQWAWHFLWFIISYRKLVARLWSECAPHVTRFLLDLRDTAAGSGKCLCPCTVSTPKEWLGKKLILPADRGALVKAGDESGFQRTSWAPGCSGRFSLCHWAWSLPAAGMGAGALHLRDHSSGSAMLQAQFWVI